MSLKKRLISIAAVVALIAGVLYVGNSGMMISDSNANLLFGNRDTLYFWYSDESLTDYLNSAAVAYNEVNSEIRVVPVLQPGSEYLETINTASLEENNAPDLYLLSNDSLEKAYMAGLAMEVRDEAGVCNTDNYPQVALDAVSYKGKTVAYPFYYETSVLLYNKTYLAEYAQKQLEEEAAAAAQEAGETAEDTGSTEEGETADDATDEEVTDGGNESPVQEGWSEETLNRLEQNLPQTMDDILTFGDSYDAPEAVEAVFKWDVSDVFYNYFFAGQYMIVGGDIGDDSENVDIYNLETIKCLEVFQDLNEFFYIDAEETSYQSVVDDFINGKIVFSVVTSDILKTLEAAAQVDEEGNSLQYEYGFSVVPNPNEELGGRALSITNGVVINGYSNHIKEANEFAKFLTYDYYETLYQRTGKLTAHKQDYSDNPYFAAFAQAYAQSIPMPKMIEVSNFWIQLEISMTDIWNGADVNGTLKNLSEQIMRQITGDETWVDETIEVPNEDTQEETYYNEEDYDDDEITE